ncbi:hypothetical protein BDZ94DRAFT_1120975, partial [Collybia nuda]
GRRGGMFIGGLFILVGSAIITAAQNVGTFLGGRLAPPQWRGRLGGMYNSCFFIGSMPATGAMVGTIKLHSTWAWRLPLLLQ